MENNEIITGIDQFLGSESTSQSKDMTQTKSIEKKIISDRSLVEVVDKKFITEDGRQLLI